MKKPIYLGVVVWGERHRNYLMDYCVPSLLSPNNIPAFKLGKKNKFIIATPALDWKYISSHPVAQALSRYIEIIFVEIPSCPPGYSSVLHMGIGHKIITQMMWEDKVYGGIVTSDQIFADGSMKFLQDMAQKGYDAVFTPSCFRTRSDRLFPAIHRFKQSNSESKNNDYVIDIAKQDLVRAIDMSIHDSFRIFEWSKVCYNLFSVGVYWRVYKRFKFKGFIYYTLSWAMSLADYATVADHDISMLDTMSFDGHYVNKHFGSHKNIYFATTSNEFISTSWSEADEFPIPVTFSDKNKLQDALFRLEIISKSFWDEIYDDFKRRNFRTIIYPCEEKITKYGLILRTKIYIFLIKSKKYKYVSIATAWILKKYSTCVEWKNATVKFLEATGKFLTEQYQKIVASILAIVRLMSKIIVFPLRMINFVFKFILEALIIIAVLLSFKNTKDVKIYQRLHNIPIKIGIRRIIYKNFSVFTFFRFWDRILIKDKLLYAGIIRPLIKFAFLYTKEGLAKVYRNTLQENTNLNRLVARIDKFIFPKYKYLFSKIYIFVAYQNSPIFKNYRPKFYRLYKYLARADTFLMLKVRYLLIRIIKFMIHREITLANFFMLIFRLITYQIKSLTYFVTENIKKFIFSSVNTESN